MDITTVFGTVILGSSPGGWTFKKTSSNELVFLYLIYFGSEYCILGLMKGYDYFFRKISRDDENKSFSEESIGPLFSFSKNSKIVIIGQAPGADTHLSGKPWADISGKRLIDWLGVTESEFYDNTNFAFLPMDFYYPGRNSSGHLPPRVSFARKWHPRILKEITDVQLVILVGAHAQTYYLDDSLTVKDRLLLYKNYLPSHFPLLHPSPRNNIWLKKNDFYLRDNIPHLKTLVRKILDS